MRIQLYLGGWIVAGTCVSPCMSQSFHPLGFMPGADASYADAVTADGTRVFGGSGETQGWGDFTVVGWNLSAGLTALAPLAQDQHARAYDLSPDGGTVVGQLWTSTEMQAFRWTESEGVTLLGDLAGAGVRSFAYGVSADGQTVVGHGTTATDDDPEVTQAFRWTRTQGMENLGFLPDKAEQSVALDVSADGAIIVGYASHDEMQGDFVINYHEAFRWTDATGMIGLGDFPGGESFSFATAINDAGTVIVGSSWGENGTEAFRWTEQLGMVGLGMLPSDSGALPYSDAYGVSADGAIVVGVSNGQAAVWDQHHGFRSIFELLTDLGIDLSGWHLEQARAVSADGRTIIGYGDNPNGMREAWVAVLPENAFATPEPTARIMFLTLVLSVVLLHSRRRSLESRNP